MMDSETHEPDEWSEMCRMCEANDAVVTVIVELESHRVESPVCAECKGEIDSVHNSKED